MPPFLFHCLVQFHDHFWSSYVTQFLEPQPILIPSTLPLENGKAFLQALFRLQFQTPFFHSFSPFYTQLYNSQLHYQIRHGKLHLQSSTSILKPELLQALAEHLDPKATCWYQKHERPHPLFFWIPLSDDRSLVCLGHYYYNTSLEHFAISVHLINTPPSFDLQELYFVLKHPFWHHFKTHYDKIPLNQAKLDSAVFAKELELSVRSFQKLFKRYTGLSPNQFHRHHRLLHGLHLYIFTTKTSKQICFEIGFENPNSFYHACEQHFKMSIRQLLQILQSTIPTARG